METIPVIGAGPAGFQDALFGFGIYTGLVFAPLYNFFLMKVWKLAA